MVHAVLTVYYTPSNPVERVHRDINPYPGRPKEYIVTRASELVVLMIIELVLFRGIDGGCAS